MTYTSDDIEEIALLLRKNGNIIFSYSGDLKSCFIINLSINFNVCNTICFSGNPEGHLLVGVVNRGFCHIPLEYPIHLNYIAEKLDLNSTNNAEQITILLESIRQNLKDLSKD